MFRTTLPKKKRNTEERKKQTKSAIESDLSAIRRFAHTHTHTHTLSHPIRSHSFLHLPYLVMSCPLGFSSFTGGPHPHPHPHHPNLDSAFDSTYDRTTYPSTRPSPSPSPTPGPKQSDGRIPPMIPPRPRREKEQATPTKVSCSYSTEKE